MYRHILGYICLLSILSGCAVNIQAKRISSQKYPPQPEDHSIEIFQQAPSEIRYVKIAEIKAREYGYHTDSDVMTAFEKRARKLGGDAIIEFSVSNAYRGPFLWMRSKIFTYLIYSGIVIRFIEPW